MRDRYALTTLPTSARLVLTLFLALIGIGYLSALGNLYHRHRLADNRDGLTADDLRANFHGLSVAADDVPRAPKSRMMLQIEPGGEMRKHLSDGGPTAIRALQTWLDHGAREDTFDQSDQPQPGDPSPRETITRHCLRCHNADGGENDEAPYGPDLFTIDYRMVYRYAAPGTATATPAQSPNPVPTTIGPQSLPHLFLVTHIHMLTIPVYTLIVTGLFMLTGINTTIKNVIAPIPMIALSMDFAGWWLARSSVWFVHGIAAAGALYGLSFAAQLLTVAVTLWFGRRPVRQ